MTQVQSISENLGEFCKNPRQQALIYEEFDCQLVPKLYLGTKDEAPGRVAIVTAAARAWRSLKAAAARGSSWFSMKRTSLS